MSTLAFILGLVGVFAALIAVVTAIKAVENIRIANHTGVDPRAEQSLRQQAASKVRGS